jgi:hypothetical protein
MDPAIISSSRPEAAHFAAATGVPDERTCSLGWSVEGPPHFAFALVCFLALGTPMLILP